ncbi:hypothetical protein HK104_005532 [Borealophlyctis nickersoniae]|nr:hypothetical protein HK104_005532 [Borealophlyctis nickersoniae]
MGLFGLAAKVGIVYIAYDLYKTHHEGRERACGWDKRVEDAKRTANDTLQTVDAAARDSIPAYHLWAQKWADRRRGFGLHTPRTETLDLPDNRYAVTLDLPGIKKEDLTVSVVDEERNVIVKGSTTRDVDVDGKVWKREVDARVVLPRNVDVGSVTARMEDGVLRVEGGKREFEGRRIDVA